MDTFSKILKKTLGSGYVGSLLQEIHSLTGEPLGWSDCMAPMERIPKKIRSFFNMELVAEVRQWTFLEDYASKNTYFIRTKDNKFFEAVY